MIEIGRTPVDKVLLTKRILNICKNLDMHGSSLGNMKTLGFIVSLINPYIIGL